MIDFHTHILPCMDDGSKSVDESRLMLASLARQGVTTAIATPHFYANDESVDAFLSRRAEAYARMTQGSVLTPRVLLGAEVRYYDGISRLADLPKLCIEGSQLLLLEMPFSRWTGSQIREVIDLADRVQYTVVLAHIERYLPILSKEILTRLLEHGVLFQVNASFFEGFFGVRRAMRMLKSGMIHFIGTDCHNMASRAPNIAQALRIIHKKMGDDRANEYFTFVNDLFDQNQIN